MINYLGRYYPVHSFWHGADPRAKLLMVTELTIGIILMSGTGLWVWALLIAVLYRTARLPSKTVGAVLWQFKWLILLTFIANLGIPSSNETAPTLSAALAVTLKLIFSLLVAIWFTLTTKPFSIIDGLARLLKPVERLRIPVTELALFAGLTVRLIPELLTETEQIMLAQRLRGIQPGLNWKKSGQWIKSTFIPVFMATFRNAKALAVALEARGYRAGQPRTAMEELRFSASDVIVIAVTLAGLIGMVIQLIMDNG
jgi:energy-coupling factor transport system permease protein